MTELLDLDGCFDGVIPPMLATCSADGEPNITHLSQLFPVDDTHIAASNQFFGKTIENLATNPLAAVLVTDSQTLITYRFSLRYERTETEGDLFDRMRHSLDAVAALMNRTDLFRLRGADVYEVTGMDIISRPSD